MRPATAGGDHVDALHLTRGYVDIPTQLLVRVTQLLVDRETLLDKAMSQFVDSDHEFQRTLANIGNP